MKINNNKEEINDFSFIIHKNKYNYINKVSNNTDTKKEIKYYIHQPKSINKKKTIALSSNNNHIINKPLYRATSNEYQKNEIKKSKNEEKPEIISQYRRNNKEIDNYNTKRNIYIKLNNDNLSFNKNIFSTDNNTNSNTNYNSNNNSNNNTIKLRYIYKSKNIINSNEKTDNIFKSNQKEKEKIFFTQKQNKSREIIGKIERKKLSFDILDNNNKNINKENIKKICNDNISNSPEINQNNLIIKIDNKKYNNNYSKRNNNKKINKKEENNINIEDNGYQFITENEQGVNNGINSVKTNNFIINKPKEENLKFSSIKEYLNDNEEATEISPSQISKIIIGQIEGYKDIMDEDKNININDKSKTILELLSKYSFSFMNNNNKPSIENNSNLTFLEENSDINLNLTNSKNISSDNNIPNLTNIKNVEEDYDSEDLSIIFKNNIKSINTHSKVYLNKIIYNKSNNKKSSKTNIHNNNIKNSMNTNNTTISSGKNINKDNKINIEKIIDNNKYNNKYNKINTRKYVEQKLSPCWSTRYNLNNIKKIKNSYSNNKKSKSKTKNKNDNYDKKNIYLKSINSNNKIQKIDTNKKINSNKSNVNINKNINTNLIFNTNKSNRKNKNIKNIDDLLNNSPLNEKQNSDQEIIEENNQTKKINHYNMPIINFIKDNQEIVKAFLNNIEKEKNIKNDNNSDNINININEKNNIQCFIF